MGMRMSGAPSWARMDPSLYSTIEWTVLWGWMTTSTRSGTVSNSQHASITSSALFIMVAESTEIFGPISQFGCAQAASGVTDSRSQGRRWRNGPPEAVSRIRRTSVRAGRAGRHWNIALCSLSMGMSSAPPSCIASMNKRPDITNASLLASSTLFPARAAARVGSSPAAPTIPASTWRTCGRATTSSRAAGPASTVVAVPASRLRSSAADASSTSTANSGRYARHCTSMASTLVRAARATTR